MEHSWLREKELLQNVIPPFHTTLPVHRTSAITVRPWKSLCWRLFFFSPRVVKQDRSLCTSPAISTAWRLSNELQNNNCGVNIQTLQGMIIPSLRSGQSCYIKHCSRPGLVWSKIPHLVTVRQMDLKSCQQHENPVSNVMLQTQTDKCARISTHDFVVLSDLHPRCKQLIFIRGFLEFQSRKHLENCHTTSDDPTFPSVDTWHGTATLVRGAYSWDRAM